MHIYTEFDLENWPAILYDPDPRGADKAKPGVPHIIQEPPTDEFDKSPDGLPTPEQKAKIMRRGREIQQAWKDYKPVLEAAKAAGLPPPPPPLALSNVRLRLSGKW